MAYRLGIVVRYAQKIAGNLAVTEIKQEEHWKQSIDQVEKYLRDMRNNRSKKGPESEEIDLANYARAVELLAQYLLNKYKTENKIPNDVHPIFIRYVDILIAEYKQLHPKENIWPPNPIGKPYVLGFQGGALGLLDGATYLRKEEEFKNSTGFFSGGKFGVFAQQPAVINFLNSREFYKLKKYLNETLNGDSRDHTLFCGLGPDFFVDKAPILRRLVLAMEGQTRVGGIHLILKDFYGKKGWGVAKNGSRRDSDYDILNTGQNFMTRFFGWRTTTISLMDDLAKSIGFNTDEVNTEKLEVDINYSSAI